MKLLGWLTSVVLVFTFVVGCGADKTQKKVDSANSDLKRMEQIDLELRAKNIFISSPHISKVTIKSTKPSDLSSFETLLGEFIGRGNNVLNTAKHKDVTYPKEDQLKVQQWVNSAIQIRSDVTKALQGSKPQATPEFQTTPPSQPHSPPTSQKNEEQLQLVYSRTSQPNFWKNWHNCNAIEQETQWRAEGIDLIKFNPESDKQMIKSLPKVKRRELLKKAKSYHLCAKVILDGKMALSGKTAFEQDRFIIKELAEAINFIKRF
jgi:hypothetical protein